MSERLPERVCYLHLIHYSAQSLIYNKNVVLISAEESDIFVVPSVQRISVDNAGKCILLRLTRCC